MARYDSPAMSDARGEPNGRSSRTTPQTPMGTQPKMSTFWVSPMAPNRRVPTTPARARAGVAGAVVPTPDGCQPAKNWENVEDQLGKGTNWPTTGQPPAEDPPAADEDDDRGDQPGGEPGPGADLAAPGMIGRRRRGRPPTPPRGRRPRARRRPPARRRGHRGSRAGRHDGRRRRAGRCRRPAGRGSPCRRDDDCPSAPCVGGGWSPMRPKFQRHARMTARARARLPASSATMTSPTASTRIWGTTRTRWNGP